MYRRYHQSGTLANDVYCKNAWTALYLPLRQAVTSRTANGDWRGGKKKAKGKDKPMSRRQMKRIARRKRPGQKRREAAALREQANSRAHEASDRVNQAAAAAAMPPARARHGSFADGDSDDSDAGGAAVASDPIGGRMPQRERARGRKRNHRGASQKGKHKKPRRGGFGHAAVGRR